MTKPIKEASIRAIYFAADDDFFTFCLNTTPIIDETSGSFTFDYTNAYTEAIKEDELYFFINQKDSRIERRGCVSYRTISLPVERVINDLSGECIQELIVPEGVEELPKLDYGYGILNKLSLPSTINFIAVDFLQHFERMNIKGRLKADSIVIPQGMREHFMQIFPESLYSFIIEEIR